MLPINFKRILFMIWIKILKGNAFNHSDVTSSNIHWNGILVFFLKWNTNAKKNIYTHLLL